MYDFRYVRPDTIEAAVAESRDPDAKYLAGGMTILPTCKLRLARPSTMIDLGRIAALSGIRDTADGIEVGAMTPHDTVARDPLIRHQLPALATLAGGIGDQQVRHRGTIGGSIANNDPAADYPAAVVGLDATVHTDRRRIKGDVFFRGIFETALEPGELVTRVVFPIPDAAAYTKFQHPSTGFALIGVMVVRIGKSVRVAVIGGGLGVFRATALEEAAAREPAALADAVVPLDLLTDDAAAPGDYKAALIRVLAQRLLASFQD